MGATTRAWSRVFAALGVIAWLAALAGAGADDETSVDLPAGAASANPEPDESHGLDDPRRSPPETYMGRVIAPPMHFSGASWLIRSSRVEEERPDKLLKALKLKPGQVVCDFGCGNGFYTLEVAKRVGARGVVYAVDVQPEMLELLAERAGPRGLENVKPVLATEEESGLPERTFDLVLMIDVYHELADPVGVLKEVRASLKPEGRLVEVEFREEDPTVPIRPLHKMSQAQVMREIPANGFKLVGQYDGLPWQHVLYFARDDSPLPVHELRPWRARENTGAREGAEGISAE